MSFDEWVLAFHVLSAFAFVAALVLFWVLIVAVRRVDTPDATIRMEPIVKVGNAAAGIGAGGTLILGVWLAFSYGGYDIWDGWIIAALVLWAVAGFFGQRTGAAYLQGMNKAQELQKAGQTGPSAELLALNRTAARRPHARPGVAHRAAHPHRHDLEAGRMNGVLAAVRPDEWNFPLFLHVLGAMIFVGALLTGASTLAFARGDVRLLRLGYWTLLVVALPALRPAADRRASGSTRGRAGTRRARRSPHGSTSASSSPTSAPCSSLSR